MASLRSSETLNLNPADSLVLLYCRLIHSHQKLGRSAGAVDTHERCRRTLGPEALSPSAQRQALNASVVILLSGRSISRLRTIGR